MVYYFVRPSTGVTAPLGENFVVRYGSRAKMLSLYRFKKGSVNVKSKSDQ